MFAEFALRLFHRIAFAHHSTDIDCLAVAEVVGKIRKVAADFVRGFCCPGFPAEAPNAFIAFKAENGKRRAFCRHFIRAKKFDGLVKIKTVAVSFTVDASMPKM